MQQGKAVVVIGADPPKSDIDIWANDPDLYRLAGNEQLNARRDDPLRSLPGNGMTIGATSTTGQRRPWQVELTTCWRRRDAFKHRCAPATRSNNCHQR